MKQDEEKGVLGRQDKMTPGYQEGQARRGGWAGAGDDKDKMKT